VNTAAVKGLLEDEWCEANGDARDAVYMRVAAGALVAPALLKRAVVC
jgi:hypothetical protein